MPAEHCQRGNCQHACPYLQFGLKRRQRLGAQAQQEVDAARENGAWPQPQAEQLFLMVRVVQHVSQRADLCADAQGGVVGAQGPDVLRAGLG